MPNALTRHVGLNAGTWVIETLFKHYVDQVFKDKARNNRGKATGELRRDELLYDEIFHIVKSFMDASTHHTVEELQEFSNARTPSPPWIHVMRILVPMSCCEDAATHLIEALGGEQKAREVAGGTKWWQVRGIRGIDAQWIVARKDFNKSVRRRVRTELSERERRQISESSMDADEAEDNVKMDELGCILYFHGGGYYFGSVDQERYFLQRFARKSGCRLLAINYRLAPQYPFPCAIHDAVASYLYLIRPPPSSPHQAIDPSRIIISGDSAGGGLTLALLQVLRDSGLPLPAGGVAISPWCDLTHSFPSIHLNTGTDIIPKYGLSVYKPSPLWPAPSEDLTIRVHRGLRSRVEKMVRQYSDGHQEVVPQPNKSSESWKLPFLKNRGRSKSEINTVKKTNMPRSHSLADDARTGDVRAAAVNRSRSPSLTQETHNHVDIGGTAPLPTADRTSEQALQVETKEGEKLVVHDQVHMYAPNNLLVHPLVSPAFSFLGGLPPLLVIASDAEVLRDEIIYAAHKAAHPDRYPVKPESKRLYPKLEGIEKQYGPTQIHLQVYDQTAHVLPVLFSFSTPAKFCYRAMNAFTRYAIGTLPKPIEDAKDRQRPQSRRSLSVSLPRRLSIMKNSRRTRTTFATQVQRDPSSDGQEVDEFGNRTSESSSRSSLPKVETPPTEKSSDAGTVRFAGNPAVYLESASLSPFVDHMIRERVSITGEVRPLEAEDELAACTMPNELIGIVGELTLRRYQEGRTKWDEKYRRTVKRIQKHRARNLERARNETVRNVTQLQMHFFQNADDDQSETLGIKEGLRRTTASWAWAWALDGAERPPPSSIVARRDTEEARRLSRIADLPVDQDDKHISANKLWSYLVNRLNTEKKEAKGERSVDDEQVDAERLQKQDPAPEENNGSKKRLYFTSSRSQPRTKTDSVRGKIKRFWSESVSLNRGEDVSDDQINALSRTKSR